MRFVDCSIDEAIVKNKNRRVFLFGAGGNIRFVEAGELGVLVDQIEGVLDNGNKTEVDFAGKTFPVYKPNVICDQNDCSVIITTSAYMVEMYEQLERMNLSDEVEVYIYPLMMLKDDHELTKEEKDNLFAKNIDKQYIPKIIHSFWFSKSEKPREYQECIDSWKRYCPDYEIREYNTDNYDVTKHPFLKKAVEVGAWAYATDWARLDVTKEYGGIYMDTDVEVLKPIDHLLLHRGVFSFFSDGGIDLAAFAVEKNNPISDELLALYNIDELPSTKDGFKKYYQPVYALPPFLGRGFCLNNRFQEKDDIVVLPRYLMMPLDVAVYRRCDKDDTFAVHKMNAGWLEDGYGTKKAIKNKEFYKRLTNL